MNTDLEIIKKKYGEKMMHLCRSLFPTILENPGVLSKLMLANFEPTRFLYDDIIENNIEDEFKNYIYSLIDVEQIQMDHNKTPEELLYEAGYILYECKTEEEIQGFKKYYSSNEEICTFKGGRLNKCYVFFAVKKNVEEIKRENFTNPKREDEYGTSVISIQFSRGNINTLSIKNRYNHRVNNPDATFSNNLENIIPGLTKSFEKQYNLNINGNTVLEIPGYVKASDGKYYKYNYEIDNIYYCPNNVIINNFEAKKYELEKYIIFDYFILDIVNKNIYSYTNDSFTETIKNIERINITKENESKKINIITNDENNIVIKLDKFNRIIGYENKNLTQVGDVFLTYNIGLTEITLPQLTQVGNDFLYENQSIREITLPQLIKVGDEFLYKNRGLTEITLPNLTQVGNDFLDENQSIREITLPNLTQVGNGFLYENRGLTEITLPNLTQVGNDFLYENQSIREITLPQLIKVGDEFLYKNRGLTEIMLPNLTQIRDCFLSKNQSIREITLPNLTQVGNHFLSENQGLIEITLPNLTQVGYYFLSENQGLTEINLPNINETEIRKKFIKKKIVTIDKIIAEKLKDIKPDEFINTEELERGKSK